MKWMRLAALACVVAVAVTGCWTNRATRLRGEADRSDSSLHSQRGQRIVGYTDAHAAYRAFDGHVRLLPGDSLEFHAPAIEGTLTQRGTPPRTFRTARDSVSTIFIQHFAAGRSAVAVIGMTVLVTGVLAAGAMASKESCPFINSWDGGKYVFDGEPYGGAISEGLERSDWSELQELVTDRGQYRLLLTNEVDETQHTNSIALLAVDHPAGSTVVMEREGRAHAFRRLVPLAAATDEAGRDLLPWLREDDRAAWYPDLRAFAREDSLADTRNHITLAFPRPPGVTRAFLVSSAATGQWGSHMIRSMLSMRGNRVREFYAAIDNDEWSRRQLLEWNRSEDLFEMFVEVRCGERWARQDFIPGGGPFINERRAIPLDLGDVAGDRIELRLNPPVGFWNLNSFHLAWEEVDVQVTEVKPAYCRSPAGVDVAATLQDVDSLYLDFPNRGDRAELVFPAPPATPGSRRTVFARTRGWYEVHLHDLGEPEVAALARLAREPGFMVRRALREYAEFRRSGVLQGTEALPADAGGR